MNLSTAAIISSSPPNGMISTPVATSCLLLDVGLLDPLLVQVLDELLSLHPVDERADVAAVAEKRPAGQVQSTSCEDRRRHAVTLNCPITCCSKC